MGWINGEEQKRIREKFGVSADHMCDGCGRPIVGLVFLDPKGGYFPKPPGTPSFLPEKPRRTFCQDCDDAKTGKHRPPKPIGHVTVHGDGSVSVKTQKGTKEKVEENLKKDFAAGKKTGHGTIPSKGSTTQLLYEILKDGKTHEKNELRVKIGRQSINSALTKIAGLEIQGNRVILRRKKAGVP